MLVLHSFRPVPYGLVVRIPGFHPGGPGSIPGVGTTFLHTDKSQPKSLTRNAGFDAKHFQIISSRFRLRALCVSDANFTNINSIME